MCPTDTDTECATKENEMEKGKGKISTNFSSSICAVNSMPFLILVIQSDILTDHQKKREREEKNIGVCVCTE